jgi:hypothetical protein
LTLIISILVAIIAAILSGVVLLQGERRKKPLNWILFLLIIGLCVFDTYNRYADAANDKAEILNEISNTRFTGERTDLTTDEKLLLINEFKDIREKYAIKTLNVSFRGCAALNGEWQQSVETFLQSAGSEIHDWEYEDSTWSGWHIIPSPDSSRLLFYLGFPPKVKS